MGGCSLDLYISWVLVISSWLVGLDISPESVGIGYVVHLSVDTISIGVTVTSLYVSFAVADFFAVLSEFTIVTSDVVAKVVGSWNTVIVTWSVTICGAWGISWASVRHGAGNCYKSGGNDKLEHVSC